MFCSDCGQRASGKFCWNCGQPLAQSGGENQRVSVVAIATEDVDLTEVHWTELTNCEALLQVAEVRDRIARHATRSQKKVSGEEFLEACDKVLSPITGGVPLTLIANLTQPISTRLGLKTGKSRTERVAQPPGAVIVAILCSLAEHGQKLGEVTQHAAGCTIRAALPSDMFSLKGDLVVDVRAESSAPRSTTIVEAAITIPGQIYDWGKSKRGLEHLFVDLANLSKCA
jgi:hypothetical protein